MATSGNKTITIKIVGGGGNQASDGTQSAEENGGTQTQPINAEKLLSDGAKKKIKAGYNGFKYLAGQGISVASNAASYAWNRYTSVKEDYMAENVYNQVSTTVNRAKGMLDSIKSGAISGASIGSAFGPVGTILGGIFGGAIGGLTQSANNDIQDYTRLRGHYQKLNETNAQTQFQAQRLGLTDGGQNTLN